MFVEPLDVGELDFRTPVGSPRTTLSPLTSPKLERPSSRRSQLRGHHRLATSPAGRNSPAARPKTKKLLFPTHPVLSSHRRLAAQADDAKNRTPALLSQGATVRNSPAKDLDASCSDFSDTEDAGDNVDPVEKLLFEAKWQLLHDPTMTHCSAYTWAPVDSEVLADAQLVTVLRKQIQHRLHDGGCITESSVAFKFFGRGESSVNWEQWCDCIQELGLGKILKEKDAWRLFDFVDMDKDGLIGEWEFMNAVVGIQS